MSLSPPARLQRIASFFLCLGLSVSLRGEIRVLKQSDVPTRIFPVVRILSRDWAGQIPPTGVVNYPEPLTSLYPGQKIALALICEGSNRDKLLRDVTISARFTSAGGATETRELKPVTVRRIKAQGADMALVSLNAAGIDQRDVAATRDAMATVSYAVFQPDWKAPAAAKPEDFRISVTIKSGAPAVEAKEVVLKLRPASDWLWESAPRPEEYGAYMNRYHEDLAPGHLLTLLKRVADENKFNSLAVASFFAIAYKENSAARRAALDLFPILDGHTQFALMFVFRLGGQDISKLPSKVPANALAALPGIEPMKDPRAQLFFPEPVTPESLREVGNTMDQCWAGWMATGDPSYLRALVGLLAWAPDYAVFQAWIQSHRGLAGFNASVARGFAYQIAGWSIGSFQRTDPHAADWLSYWNNDPTFPLDLRREITALPTNLAFRR